jgi:uncharacterized repeat protein (TIGR03899 family)
MPIPVRLDIKTDIKADLTKPFCKLIDAARRGCHLLYIPLAIRRKANAEAYAAVTHARADVEVAIIKELGSQQLQQLQNMEIRAGQRVSQQSLFHQANIEAVIEKSIAQLPSAVSDAPVETDWLVTFFDNVKNISHEDMQMIWARILVGEINQPGSCSMRTLHLLKQMSQKEALLFAEFCSFLVVIEGHINPCFFTDTYGCHRNRFVMREFKQKERLLLAEMGLVNFEEDIFFSFKFGESFNLIYGNKKITIKYGGEENRSDEIKTIICGYPLTQSGKELYSICSPEFRQPFWSNMQSVLVELRFEIAELN